MVRDNLTGIRTSDATAIASDILIDKTAYIADGSKAVGTMPDRGAIDITLDVNRPSYLVPNGYHNGSGTVSITTQTKSVTPTTSTQTINADNGKVLSSVSIGAINTQTKSATPSASSQIVTPDSGKYLSSVSIEATPTETKSVTPTGSAQTIYPSGGKFLSSVSVGAVTKNSGIGNTIYVEGYSAGDNAGYSRGVSDTKIGTATASDVLSGKTFTNGSSVGIGGSMVNQGAWTSSITP